MIDLYLAPTANGLRAAVALEEAGLPNFATRKAPLDQAGGLTNLQRWGAAMAARPGVARRMKFLG